MLQTLKNLLLKNKSIFYLWYYNRAKFQFSRHNQMLIVHTPGHVASSSVFRSLENYKPELPYVLLDIHSLKRKYNENSQIPSLSARHVLQEALVNSLPKFLIEKKVKLICVVRDPVSRALSSFFHAFNIWHEGKSLNKIQDPETEFRCVYDKITKSESSGSFLNRTILYQTTWFENQVKPFFPIDLEKDIFIKNEDFHIYKNGNVELLVLKAEKLNESFEKATEDFLGEVIKLINTNTHSSRVESNSDFYNYTKKNFKLPPQQVEEIYNSAFMKRFYTQSEIEKFKNNWKEN